MRETSVDLGPIAFITSSRTTSRRSNHVCNRTEVHHDQLVMLEKLYNALTKVDLAAGNQVILAERCSFDYFGPEN